MDVEDAVLELRLHWSADVCPHVRISRRASEELHVHERRQERLGRHVQPQRRCAWSLVSCKPCISR
jgi:hypothetical protein